MLLPLLLLLAAKPLGPIPPNGNFELGFLDWNVDFASSDIYSYAGTTFIDASGGVLLVGIGEPYSASVPGGLDQTVTDGAGQHYHLTFDICTLDNTGANNITVTWHGATVYNGIAPYSSTNTLIRVSYDVIGTGSDNLMFEGFSNQFLIGIDNVLLTPFIPPPVDYSNPYSLPMIGVG